MLLLLLLLLLRYDVNGPAKKEEGGREIDGPKTRESVNCARHLPSLFFYSKAGFVAGSGGSLFSANALSPLLYPRVKGLLLKKREEGGAAENHMYANVFSFFLLLWGTTATGKEEKESVSLLPRRFSTREKG